MKNGASNSIQTTENVMKRQTNECPMSMIMALDKFEFLYQNPLNKYADDDDKDDEDDWV